MIQKGDCLDILPQLDSESIDLLVTDPPYGISFMGKDWDKALPDIRVWKECLRVLKPGAFAFVMSIPRSDCLSRMIISLEDAGFRVDFSPIYWAFASGFPKAQNMGKAVDKRLGAERGRMKPPQVIDGWRESEGRTDRQDSIPDNNPITPQAKALDGSYGGCQLKPAVEVIIVAMKPLSEKTFVDQALTNGKGITWLDDCRVPYESEGDIKESEGKNRHADFDSPARDNKIFGPDNRPRSEQGNYCATAGRFPANLICSDDVLNDGRDYKTGDIKGYFNKNVANSYSGYRPFNNPLHKGDSGSFSRYFDLDKWAQKTFPFLIAPKASKSEKNKGCEELYWRKESQGYTQIDHEEWEELGREEERIYEETGKRVSLRAWANIHSTVKPLKLMSYLITLGSREGDVVLDPYLGSGTTALAASLLGRKCIGIELDESYAEIANKRCSEVRLL